MDEASVYNLYRWVMVTTGDSNAVRSVHKPTGAIRIVVPFQSVSRKASVLWH